MNRFRNVTLRAKRIDIIRGIFVFIGQAILLSAAPALQPAAAQNADPTAKIAKDTIYVSPPTGEREIDRASIQAAIEKVQPGGTVQFAQGKYVIGKVIQINIPQITLLGHPDGTILRGCNPEEFTQIENALAVVSSPTEGWAVVSGCGMLELTGGFVTVRNFTFEYSRLGILLGSSHAKDILYPADGGYLIEENTFRNSCNSIRALLGSPEPTIIRNNRFINVFHAFSGAVSYFHILDNHISVLEPEKIPLTAHPGFAIGIHAGAEDSLTPDKKLCDQNIIQGNWIEGHPDGITISSYYGKDGCQKNVIENNSILVKRVPFLASWPYFDEYPLTSKEDSTFIGIPLALYHHTETDGQTHSLAETKDNLIRGNMITAGFGLGIEISNASQNRIVNNTITGIVRRAPFPGNTLGGTQFGAAANGYGIWFSPGSNENKVTDNSFEEIASNAVFIEGSNNRVMVRKEIDLIRNLGTGNQINEMVVPDTIHYTIIIDGHNKAKRLQWKEAPNTWRYEYKGQSYDSYHFPRSERLVLDAEGFPLKMEISGQRIFWDQWIESFERIDGRAQWTVHSQSKLGPEWSRTLDKGETKIFESSYYNAVHPVHDPGVLARLLLNQPDKKLPLLPNGTARLELINERLVEMDNDRRNISLYAIHGIDLRPTYVWLDEKYATFADEWSVLAGWEESFPTLRSDIEEALADYHHRLVKDLIPPVREKPLIIHGARLFDPETHLVHSGTTIIIENNHISAIGPDDSLKIPAGAEMINAKGQMAIPGLWDMHTHHGISETFLELMAPLYLAGGITTARDLGSPTESILSLRKRIEEDEALGSRLLLAGWIEGGEGRPTGPLVSNAAEAREAVDRFAELGYVQIKIYGSLSPDLVPVVIERAKKHGLRVSGHIPQGLTWQEAVGMGYDEIQHFDYLINPLLSKKLADLGSKPTPELLDKFNKAQAEITTDSEEIKEMITLLASKNIGIDPTLALFDAKALEPQGWVKRVADRFPSAARRQILDLYLFGYWPLNPLRQKTFENFSDIVTAMHQAGVTILPGSDMEIAGFSLHRELEIYTEAGIPAPEVLTLATLGAARVMGMDDELGSIEPGKLADLILVDGDPTKNISDIRRVMTVIKDGKVYDPAAIHRALSIEPCCEK